jgi:hypothetical protein
MRINDLLEDDAAVVHFHKLSDAGPDYEPGETQIWYWKAGLSRDMKEGFDFLKEYNKLPNPSNLAATHVMIGTVKETNPHAIYNMMQGEIWSPLGQAKDMIARLNVGHTSMSVGDIVVINGKKLFADKYTFKDLVTGDKV